MFTIPSPRFGYVRMRYRYGFLQRGRNRFVFVGT